MRDIKFRAWAFDDEFMIDEEYNDNDFVFTMEEGKPKLLEAKFDQINQVVSHYGECNHEIMQYTGLKDKNGVEIYEGDILNFDWRLQATNDLYADDCENIKGLVLFESAKFIVRYFNKSMSFDLSDVNQNTFERFWRETYVSAKDDYFKMTDFEVVGNIYQNPELIK